MMNTYVGGCAKNGAEGNMKSLNFTLCLWSLKWLGRY
jgi:hypothetical protein